jgi:hypothetical protein
MSTRDKNVTSVRNAAIVAAACVLAPATFGLASCSLGLDESLIGQQPDVGAGDGQSQGETSVPEGGDGALPPIQPEAGICTKDEDCKGTAGCLTARCDVPRKACVLEVCRQPACNSAACDTAAQKCGAAMPYKYRAAQFPVGAQIGCGGALGRCFAAVYPYVFVGTTNGVVAFAANNPQNPAPAAVPITGLTFVPTQMVASGSRMYFLGAPVGTGPTSRIPVAYADVPPDPFATKIGVTTVLASHNRPASDPVALVARGNDTALLIDANAATAYASAPIEAPLVEPVSLASTGFAFTAGAGPVAVSGARLVMGQIAPSGLPSFAFVDGAGGGTPMTGPDTAIPTANPASGPWYFAQSADGAVFWSFVALNAPPGGMTPPGIRAVRGYFLVADSAAQFDPAAGIDLEVYPMAPGVGTPTAGPVAMLDAKTAMVTTSNPANPGMLTNVSFVTRGPPLGFVKNADMNLRRFPITVPVSQLAAAGSNGLGYILAVDPAAPTAPTVYVFDPACAP